MLAHKICQDYFITSKAKVKKDEWESRSGGKPQLFVSRVGDGVSSVCVGVCVCVRWRFYGIAVNKCVPNILFVPKIKASVSSHQQSKQTFGNTTMICRVICTNYLPCRDVSVHTYERAALWDYYHYGERRGQKHMFYCFHISFFLKSSGVWFSVKFLKGGLM